MTKRALSNRQILQLAINKAKVYGDPTPRTRDDVEKLTGMTYYGPDPEAIGRTQHPTVKRLS